MQEKLYKIEQPHIPNDWEIAAAQVSDPQKKAIIDISENPEYLHWDKIKYKKFQDFSWPIEIAWAIIQHHRHTLARITPIQNEDGAFFEYIPLQRWEKTIHFFDKVFLNQPLEQNRPVEPWMMEAISSAMIEGAHTTRERALELLQLHKTPADYSERMILNNYKMAKMLENLPPDFQVDIKTLLDWQMHLTHQTLAKKDQGRLRNNADKIVIAPKTPDIVTFIPPARAFLDTQLNAFLSFVNQEKSGFHPLIQAIGIHFWFAYLHPFVDGNGRTARALFYWFLMKSGYPNITSLPLSPLILRSLKQYSKAFIYSEQDNYNLTYFIDFNMRLIEKALEQFKLSQTTEKGAEGGWDEQWNLRQNTILRLLKNKELKDVNVSYVQQKFGVSKLTSINDLKELVAQGILESRRVGKNVLYSLKK